MIDEFLNKKLYNITSKMIRLYETGNDEDRNYFTFSRIIRELNDALQEMIETEISISFGEITVKLDKSGFNIIGREDIFIYGFQQILISFLDKMTYKEPVKMKEIIKQLIYHYNMIRPKW